MNFLWNWGSRPEEPKENILKDYPALVYYHELISGSRQAWTGQDFDSQIYTKFQKKYPLTSANLANLLSKLFKKVGQPPRAFTKNLGRKEQEKGSWIFRDEDNDVEDMREFHEKIFMFLDQMKSVNKVLEKQICVFANRKSKLIREALPGIQDLQTETNRIRRLIVKMKVINLSRTKRTQRKNLLIRQKFLKKRRLLEYLSILRRKVMSNLFVLNTQALKDDPVHAMTNMIHQIEQNGQFATKFVLYREKRRLKELLLRRWSQEMIKGEAGVSGRVLTLVHRVTHSGFLCSLDQIVAEVLELALGTLVSENLHRTIFIDESSNSKISKGLKDHMKLDILVPLMNSQNVSSFFRNFFRDCVRLFQAVDDFLRISLRRRFIPDAGADRDAEEAQFFRALWEETMRKKKLLAEDTSRILRKMFLLVNKDEVGELGVGAILGLLKGYERFLGSLQVFSFHFPRVPNEELNGHLLIPFIEKSKQKSIRTCFHEILDENWSALSFQPEHILKRIDKFLGAVKDADFQTTKLTPEEIGQFALDRKAFICDYSFKGPPKEFTSQKKYMKWLASPNQLSATPMSKSLAGRLTRQPGHLPVRHHHFDHFDRLLQNGQDFPRIPRLAARGLLSADQLLGLLLHGPLPLTQLARLSRRFRRVSPHRTASARQHRKDAFI